MAWLVLLRRVEGMSMAPTLLPGRIVIASRLAKSVNGGDVVLLRHEGIEKIKRIKKLKANKIQVIGDNLSSSTDSRHFGWLDTSTIIAKVIWPRV